MNLLVLSLALAFGPGPQDPYPLRSVDCTNGPTRADSSRGFYSLMINNSRVPSTARFTVVRGRTYIDWFLDLTYNEEEQTFVNLEGEESFEVVLTKEEGLDQARIHFLDMGSPDQVSLPCRLRFGTLSF